MATKVVVGPDGSQKIVDLTPEEEAQRLVDEQAHVVRQAAKDAENTRVGTFTDDPARVEFIDHLKTATAADIDAFVRTRLNADGVTDLASQKEFDKRVENAMATMLKLLVKAVRD